MNFDEYGKKAKEAVKSVAGYVAKKFRPEKMETAGTVTKSTAQTLKDASSKADNYIKNMGNK